ncbi:MAG: hypothetical protein OIF57_15580 [Marinobacterium sp.]|nr:hypothetical protein [Marinobacterium sp.]
MSVLKPLVIKGVSRVAVIFGMLVAGMSEGQADQAIKLLDYDDHCGGVSVVITDADRFDPLVQQVLTERQLDKYPKLDKPVFMVLPGGNEQRLTEYQIRYLERLLRD